MVPRDLIENLDSLSSFTIKSKVYYLLSRNAIIYYILEFW